MRKCDAVAMESKILIFLWNIAVFIMNDFFFTNHVLSLFSFKNIYHCSLHYVYSGPGVSLR